ncbi:MAG TPA: hypothetical protein VKB88_43130 [Bryobacteraceae bacterium]|nr:hypothetical protein [Bryobacteraceae bacterium]
MGESLPDESARVPWFRKAYATLVRAQTIDAASSQSFRHRPRGSLLAADDAELYAELGRIYSHLGQPLPAVAALEKARIVRRGAPEDDDSIALAGVYASADEWRKAAVTMLEGSMVNPDNPVFVNDLPAIYSKSDPHGCEIRNGALDLACSAAHADVCTALANVIRLRRARGERQLADIAAENAQKQFDCPVPP